MPIGGGTFTAMNKIIPGAYINFVSLGNGARMGERGVTTFALALDWGPENEIITIQAADFLKEAKAVFGYDPTAPQLLLIREALKRAKTLLLYRSNSGGTKATVTVDDFTVTAKWGGVRGNDLKVEIRANADDDTLVDVITYLDVAQVDIQTVAAAGGAANLKANAYVTFSASALLAPTAAQPLTGGTNGTEDGASHAAYLVAVEVEAFTTIGYPGTDETVKGLYGAFVKRLRYDEGKKVVGVLYQYAGDDIGLINVKNGVKLTDGTTLNGSQAVAWVAGAAASAEINESLTNTAYDDAVDVDIKYTTSQLEAAIQAGEFVFYADSGKARALTDINSLTTIGQDESEDWTSNRVVRVMDGWANDVARIFGQSYIGLVTNNDTGRQLFKADLVSLGTQYERLDAISNFLSEDITVEQGSGKRDVVVTSALAINDSMEKLYMTTVVR